MRTCGLLISELVKTKWNNDISFYQDKGYVFTGYKTDLWVKPEDLSKNSLVKVEVACDICGTHKSIAYTNYRSNLERNNGSYRCHSCFTKSTKPTLEYIRKCFAERGYLLLSTEYKGTLGGLEFTCINHPEHLQITSWNRFSAQKSGCMECVKEQFAEQYLGENNPNYKGGKNTIYQLLRNHSVAWRRRILKQHKNRCIISGDVARHVHHLKAYRLGVIEAHKSLGIELRRLTSSYRVEELSALKTWIADWEDNICGGVPLTKKLHDEFHDKYTLYAFTPENFSDFYFNKLNTKFLNLPLRSN